MTQRHRADQTIEPDHRMTAKTGRNASPPPAAGLRSVSWSLPGEWPHRRGAPAPDAPTQALPGPFRVVHPEPHREHFAAWRRYRDLDLVGVGGMGRVYRAREPKSGETVALKFLVEGRRRGDELREARLQMHLDHPGVLPVLDTGKLGGHPWFAMPFVEGVSLKTARHDLDLETAVGLMIGVARTAEAIHGAGIVHCDLNPRNVLVAGRGEPRRTWVIDFGIAQEMAAPVPADVSKVIGTPAYMAPEQALGKLHHIGPATDVYALGATLYELACGQHPFSAPTSEAMLTKAIQEPPKPLHDLNADVPERLETVILRCLEKDPEDRYGSAAELAAALEDCLEGN